MAKQSEKGTETLQKSIKLTPNDLIDITGLTEEQVAELRQQHASGLIDIHKKATELSVDVNALTNALHTFTDQTAKATAVDAHTTITHTQTSSLGRTEVVIGNTDRAKSGKVSRSAAGESNRSLMIVGIIAVVAIIIALIAFS